MAAPSCVGGLSATGADLINLDEEAAGFPTSAQLSHVDSDDLLGLGCSQMSGLSFLGIGGGGFGSASGLPDYLSGGGAGEGGVTSFGQPGSGGLSRFDIDDEYMQMIMDLDLLTPSEKATGAAGARLAESVVPSNNC